MAIGASAHLNLKTALRGISVRAVGEGRTVVLLHGFAASSELDWWKTGWAPSLLKAGRKVVTPDCLGHGNSEKPHDPRFYRFDRLIDDARHVVDLYRSDDETVDLVGYSMGAHIALGVALAEPAGVGRMVLGGMGHNIIGTIGLDDGFVRALESEENAASSALAKFRASAMAVDGNDPLALAACLRGQRGRFPVSRLADIDACSLLFKGAEDRFTGDLAPVAKAMGGKAEMRVTAGNHATALQDPAAIASAVAFLNKQTA